MSKFSFKNKYANLPAEKKHSITTKTAYGNTRHPKSTGTQYNVVEDIRNPKIVQGGERTQKLT